MKTQAEIDEAVKRQAKLCVERGLPHFAPHNGICWACRRQIYEHEDGSTFITGCPCCSRSYCD